MSTTTRASSASSPEAGGTSNISGQNDVTSNRVSGSFADASIFHSQNDSECNFIISKLQCLKEVHEKTLQLESLRKQLKSEVNDTHDEEKCLSEYKREMESLISEKMAHVEELRQIHTDIQSMELVIRQSEEERSKHLQMAEQLHQEYEPLKEIIDKLRGNIGLGPLPQEEDEILSIKYRERTPKDPVVWSKSSNTHPSSHDSHNRSSSGYDARSCNNRENQEAEYQQCVASQQVSSSLIASAAASQLQHHLSSMHAAVERVGLTSKASNSKNAFMSHRVDGQSAANSQGDRSSSLVSSSAMRQSQPPMKSCQSCHQQIHRNAPICPLCKAKSRSRNPKKPKRRVED